MWTRCLLLLLIVVVFTFPRSVAARQWTSSSGEHRIEAELVSFDSERVRLKKQDGKIVVVPLDQLGDVDRKWIEELARKQGAARSLLEKKGFRVSSDGLQTPEELELKNGLRDLPKLKKTLLDAGRQLEVAQKQVDENKAAIDKLTEAHRQLNTRLALIRPHQVTLNNKLVAALQANKAQVVLLVERDKKLKEQLSSARTDVCQARKSYVEAVMKLRTLVVDIVGKYEESANDKEIVDALARLNELTPDAYVLGESRTLAASIRQLDKLEEQIFSESIPLRADGGRMYAPVIINGEHAQEMVVDVGAPINILPLGMANECGIQVSATDKNVTISFGDGKELKGKLVTLKSLRVGKFTLSNVRCAVLGIDALNAKPLLGKTFLEKYQYEINAKKGTLTLIEVATVDKAPGT